MWRVDHAPSGHDDTVCATGLAIMGLYETIIPEEPKRSFLDHLNGPPPGIDDSEFGGNLWEDPLY